MLTPYTARFDKQVVNYHTWMLYHTLHVSVSKRLKKSKYWEDDSVKESNETTLQWKRTTAQIRAQKPQTDHKEYKANSVWLKAKNIPLKHQKSLGSTVDEDRLDLETTA